MPSPAIATTRPSACSRATTAAFCSGSTSATTSSMPELAATASAVVRAVAGQHHDAQALARAAPRAPRACVALIGSATPSRPATAPSTATNITVCALAAQRLGALARARRRRRRAPPAARGCPSATSWPSTRPATPLPVSESKSLGRARAPAPRSRGAGDDRRGQRMLAAALEAGREPQQLGRRPKPSARLDARRASACPRSSVPVLSTTSVSTSRSTSIASAFRNSTPAVAPRAGRDHDRHRRRQAQRARAGDDQHRDRVDQRVGQRAAPARRSAQTAKVDDGDRRRPPARSSRRRRRRALDRRAAALRLGHHLHDLRQQRVGADALGAHHERAGAVDRGADHAGRRRSSRPGSARR